MYTSKNIYNAIMTNIFIWKQDYIIFHASMVHIKKITKVFKKITKEFKKITKEYKKNTEM